MLTLTSYFSVGYLGLYLPAAVVLYALLPRPGARRAVLLGFSYLCYWAVSGRLIVYLLLSTLCVYLTGLWLAALQRRRDLALEHAPRETRRTLRAVYQRRLRLAAAWGVLLHIGLLAGLKYSRFFAVNLNRLLGLLPLTFSIEPPSFALPIGLSFFTLQAVSYLLDVYRQTIPADSNLFRLALYMGFFPQIMEGPICRYAQTAGQLWQAPPLCRRNLHLGLLRIVWGCMKKILVADRLNVFLKAVFDGPGPFGGLVVAAAAVGYTIQLYMDFSGTMDLALGAGQIFGFQLPENFRRPFRSASISQFWRRWHISLGTWFKDYLFYPLALSKPLKALAGRARKRPGGRLGPLLAGTPALLCVWICNGLWHGPAWSYLFFGLYHFALIFLENLTEPWTAGVTARLSRPLAARLWLWLRRLCTALLVCVGELFFRANGLRAGLALFARMVSDFSLEPLTGGSLFTLGMDPQDWLVTLLMLAAVSAVGALEERGRSPGEALLRAPAPLRAALYYVMLLSLALFGAYGPGYMPVDPIYAGF